MRNAALIGHGYWGTNIAKNLARSKYFNLSAICDADPAQLEKARSVYGDSVKYCTDYTELTSDPDLYMIAVALRGGAQAVARDVLRGKKHLFMEKPMATSTEDAKLLIQLAEENGVQIHVDHIMVYHPVVRRMKEIIDSGELGELVYFESNRTNLGPHIKRNMNAMWDLAVHDLAVMDYLCGGIPVRKVNCIGQKQFGEQEILTYLTLQYDSMIAMLKSTWFSPIKERRITIAGSKKMMVFDDVKESEKLTIYDKGVSFDSAEYAVYGNYEAKVRSGDLYSPYIPFEDSLLNGLEQFAECIEAKRPSLSDPAQALRVIEILEQAFLDLRGEKEAICL